MRVCLVPMLFVACGLWCIAARAADTPSTNAGNQAAPGSGNQIVRASDLTGLKVYNDKNENLGKVEDLVIDPTAGTIRYAVLSFGGFLGMGDKYFAIPWKGFSFVSKGQTSSGTEKESYCVLNVPKDFLKDAPGFDKNNWPNFADANWRQKIEQFYENSSALRGQGQRR